MTIKNLSEELSGCAYPGRGIVAGMSEDGKKATNKTRMGTSSH